MPTQKPQLRQELRNWNNGEDHNILGAIIPPAKRAVKHVVPIVLDVAIGVLSPTPPNTYHGNRHNNHTSSWNKYSKSKKNGNKTQNSGRK